MSGTDPSQDLGTTPSTGEPWLAQPPYPPYAPQPPIPPAHGQQPPAGQPLEASAYAPPPPPPQYPEQPPAVPMEPPRRSGRGWIWWLVGTFVLLTLCGLASSAIVALDRSGSMGGSFGGDAIAVIPMDGTISNTSVGASTITPESFLNLLQRAQDDESVKAIVLRVNSPGGTVAASEEIATYVKNATKPVVVSVGDMDASGAYMVSSQADKIVANPGSAVGSIGVILEVPDASALLNKVGLSFKVITAGKYKDAGSPYRALTATETAMLQGQVDQVYGQFIDIVASGRGLPRSEVASMATGWAWNGAEAKQLHLVDQLGTYEDALKVAAKLGHVQGEYRTEVYSDTSQLSGLLSSLLGIESELKSIAAAAQSTGASAASPVLAK